MVIAKMRCVMLTCSHVRIYITERLAEAVLCHATISTSTSACTSTYILDEGLVIIMVTMVVITTTMVIIISHHRRNNRKKTLSLF